MKNLVKIKFNLRQVGGSLLIIVFFYAMFYVMFYELGGLNSSEKELTLTFIVPVMITIISIVGVFGLYGVSTIFKDSVAAGAYAISAASGICSLVGVSVTLATIRGFEIHDTQVVLAVIVGYTIIAALIGYTILTKNAISIAKEECNEIEPFSEKFIRYSFLVQIVAMMSILSLPLIWNNYNLI